MISRRGFILSGTLLAAGLFIAKKMKGRTVTAKTTIRKGTIRKALVTWYSQTGNTAKIGRAMAGAWKAKGLQVESGDYREMDRDSLGGFDIIAVGTPVFYYEVPGNLRQWLESIPEISGIPVAPFVTFGGKGGNQRNTMSELAGLLASKGGVPVGAMGFSGMSTYAITWSMGNRERILKYRTLPDANSGKQAADFALQSLDRAARGIPAGIRGEFSVSNLFRGDTSITLSNLLTTGHGVDRSKCTDCGACTRACPMSAIDPEKGEVDRDRCILCLGCINNCPSSAVTMKFLGNNIYGYREFVKRNGLDFRHLPI
jgi:NAD-dependent dihydropyrimidine dehydrogenase PreA subunit/flavodoxin